MTGIEPALSAWEADKSSPYRIGINGFRCYTLAPWGGSGEKRGDGDPPTALPGITRELVKLLERAEELGTEPEPDFVDVLRARRRGRQS